LPEFGLGAIFLVSLLASTLLPLGSEPALLTYVALTPSAVWLAVGVATAGNTLGGVITYWMGAGARRALAGPPEDSGPAMAAQFVEDVVPASEAKTTRPGRWQAHAEFLAQRFGAPVLLFSWLPLVGDPLCGVAGWMRMPFWSCLFYIAVGKFARYAVICAAMLQFFPMS
jgi:membrane protein YqaA with SNARE-associated domain